LRDAIEKIIQLKKWYKILRKLIEKDDSIKRMIKKYITIKRMRTKSERKKHHMRIKLKENFNCMGYLK